MNNSLTALALGKIDVLRNETPQYDNGYLFEIDGNLVKLEELIECWRKTHDKNPEKENNVDCNTIGINTSIQKQNTGKKSRKSTKKTTTTQK